jgi:phosphoglycolate phosphatase
VNPGVREALAALANQEGVAVGLATGNVEAAARVKLTPGGLNHHFEFGGYGSDAAERAELTEIAAQRAEHHIGRSVPREGVVVVGDSIHDIRAAHAIGALSVAVCTGWTSADILERERPTLLKECLDSEGDWLRELQLLNAG